MASCCPIEPLVVAEQFGTLTTLYPNRVNWVLAEHLEQIRSQCVPYFVAVRKLKISSHKTYWKSCNTWEPHQRIVATPGQNTHVPVWLLGSSLFSAQLAAKSDFPFYSFASHFALRCWIKRSSCIEKTLNLLSIWIVLMFPWVFTCGCSD